MFDKRKCVSLLPVSEGLQTGSLVPPLTWAECPAHVSATTPLSNTGWLYFAAYSVLNSNRIFSAFSIFVSTNFFNENQKNKYSSWPCPLKGGCDHSVLSWKNCWWYVWIWDTYIPGQPFWEKSNSRKNKKVREKKHVHSVFSVLPAVIPKDSACILLRPSSLIAANKKCISIV